MSPAKRTGPANQKDAAIRIARHPATGHSIQVAASKQITFRPIKERKEAVSLVSNFVR